MHVRLGTEQDIDTILLMAEEFWKTTIYDEPFHVEHTRAMVELCLQHNLVVVLTDVNDIAVGFIAGVSSPLLASPDALYAVEIGYYIMPSYRQGGSAIGLLKRFEQQCSELGVKYINLIAMESSYPEIAKKIYSRMGYKLNESVYTKVI